MSLDFFKDDGVFLPMLNDPARNTFYKQCLDIAAPGQVVCDIGAGTGLLSIMALQAGASKVIAVERDADRYQYLCNNLQRLNLQDKIETVQGDFVDHDIAADVYVTETLNTQIFGEDILKLSNHAQRRGGQFIPGYFKIWAEVYQDHPVFILDLSRSEAYDFSPTVAVDQKFVNIINQDVQQQYSLAETVFRANQLNRLFPMLDCFGDLRLKKIGATEPVIVDLNSYNTESNITVTVPIELCQSVTALGRNAMVVLQWQAVYHGIVLDSTKAWFGNVAKSIRPEFATGADVVFRYDPAIRDWRLSY